MRRGNAVRGALYGCGIGLPVWALSVAFLDLRAAVIAAITGAVLLLVAGFFDYRAPTDLDRHFDEAKQVIEPDTFDAIIAAQFGAVWPHEAGAPE